MAPNVAASVRARLTNLAKERGDVVDRVFLRYAIERLLYRLSVSGYRDQFVLKGAMLFSLWAPVPYRSTGDLDLLGQGDPTPARLAAIFTAVCAVPVEDDGLMFDPDSVVAESMRDDEDYPGVRITLPVKLAGAQLSLQIDIGFGDAVTPAATEIAYPSALGFPVASLRAYPPETVVAEKLEALVSLGMLNTRMKDFFDLWVIAKTFAFESSLLGQAVRATFERRGTAIPTQPPVALTATFSGDASKTAQWAGFLKRTHVAIAPAPLPELVDAIAAFTLPLLTDPQGVSTMRWEPGGPWRRV